LEAKEKKEAKDLGGKKFLGQIVQGNFGGNAASHFSYITVVAYSKKNVYYININGIKRNIPILPHIILPC